MPTVGPYSPTSAAGLSYTYAGSAGRSWSTPTNIVSNNGAYAVAGSVNAGNPSQVLAGWGYGAAVQDNLDGILVEAQVHQENGNQAALTNVQLYDRNGSSNPSSGHHIGTAKSVSLSPPTSDNNTYLSVGGSADTWGLSGEHLTAAFLNSTDFAIGLYFTASGGNNHVNVDHLRVTFYYTVANVAPTISSAPSVSYGSLSRLGPNNTPVTVTFTAIDEDTLGSNALSYEIRTAAAGGGTLVGSGTCTSGVSKQHSIANTASGLVDGSQTLYLRVTDSFSYSDDSSFTLKRDTGAPAINSITTEPSLVYREGGS